MDPFIKNWHEWIGHLGTLLVVLSVMQHNVKRVRIFMLLGSISFSIYGALIGAIPVLIANVIIGLVSLRYLIMDCKKSNNHCLNDGQAHR